MRRRKPASGCLIAVAFLIGGPLYLLSRCGAGDAPKDYHPTQSETVAPYVSEAPVNDEPKYTFEPEYSAPDQEETPIASQETEEIELQDGGAISVPIAITSDELVRAVKNDLEGAKSAYKGKWLEVTGKVISVDYHDVGVLTYTDPDGSKRSYTVGEMQYNIDGINIKSGLIYWMNDRAHSNMLDIIIDMEDYDVYYKQNSTITIVGQCVSIDEGDVIIQHGTYPEK